MIDLVSGSTSEIDKKYGFIYVDQDNKLNGTKKQYIKDSFYWYKELIKKMEITFDKNQTYYYWMKYSISR